jgi:putative aldouronate transport system substrate-binding protein
MKSRFVVYLVVFAMCLSIATVAGCQKNETTGPSGATTSTTSGTTKETTTNGQVTVQPIYPIVPEKVTLTAMGYEMQSTDEAKKAPGGSNNYQVLLQEVEATTNVHLEWTQIPVAAWSEQVNLKFASDELTDIFIGCNLTRDMEISYGIKAQQLIPLNALVDKYTFFLKFAFEQMPDIRPQITNYDGNIYSLPELSASKLQRAGVFNWIEKAALEASGMAAPTTTDELLTLLRWIRDNYKPEDGLPVLPYAAFKYDYNEMYALDGSFGLNETLNHVGLVDGAISYLPLLPQYKRLLQYFNTLYTEKLINEDFISLDGTGMAGLTKTFHCAGTPYHPIGLGIADWETFTVLPVLKGPDGTQMTFPATQGLYAYGTFAITKNCKMTEVAMRYADYWYSQDISEKWLWGKTGVHWGYDVSGKYTSLTVPEGGLGIMNYTTQYTVGWPVFMNAEMAIFSLGSPFLSTGTDGSFYQPAVQAYGLVKRAPFQADDAKWQLPAYLPFTKEESDQVSQLQADVNTYVDSMKAKFITGAESFDNWDAFVQKVKDIGGDQIQKLYADTYAKFLTAK